MRDFPGIPEHLREACRKTDDRFLRVLDASIGSTQIQKVQRDLARCMKIAQEADGDALDWWFAGQRREPA